MEKDNYYFSENFKFHNGHLYCEKLKISDIRSSMSTVFPSSPFFVYSKAAICKNIQQYKTALRDCNYILNFSMKANNNITVLKLMKGHGCSLTLVSGMELQLALDLGFEPSKLMFNGNGKMKWELEMAVKAGVLLNIDSAFNLRQTLEVCEKYNKKADVLLRINPCMNVDIHQYFATGKGGSKFGLDKDELENCLEIIKATDKVRVVGLHCHLGTTIYEIHIVRKSVELLQSLLIDLKSRGFQNMTYLNIGGGLGIPYEKHADRTCAIQNQDLEFIEELEQKLRKLELEGETQNGMKELAELCTTIEDFKNYRISKHDFLNEVEKYQDYQDIILNGLKIAKKQHYPTISDMITGIKDLIDMDITVVLEPGRSLVGNAAILVNTVLGCKNSGDKKYIIVDGAMTDVIRPSFYGAYHHIDLTEPSTQSDDKQLYDVVGPVCECGDFLGQDRLLTTPFEGCGLAVFDVGAYCTTMASNYNMRLKPAEIMVDRDSWRIIRQPDTYQDLIKHYTDKIEN